jgi:branched-chain amino acid transport system ATP-binding protein
MIAMRRLADAGLGIIMVEQFAEAALAIGDTAHVMRRGRMVYNGTCAELRSSIADLHLLYLGEEGQTGDTRSAADDRSRKR